MSLLFSVNIYAQTSSSENNDTINLSKITDALVLDQISYEQFLLLGKCRCQDIIDKNNNSENVFNNTFSALYDLRNPLPRLIEKSCLQNYLESYIIESLKVTVKQFKKDDEYYSNSKSSILPCEKIFRQSNYSMQLYVLFVSNYLNYNSVVSNRLEYLKNGFINTCDW